MRARKTGTVRVIDIITARLDAKIRQLSRHLAEPATE